MSSEFKIWILAMLDTCAAVVRAAVSRGPFLRNLVEERKRAGDEARRLRADLIAMLEKGR